MTIFELSLWPLTIAPSYYGLMYVLWFISWYIIIEKRWIISKKMHDTLLLYVFLWVIIWWRLWYVLFYDLWYYLNNISSIIKIWEWWMSFHGWAIWVIVAVFLLIKIHKLDFFKIINEVALVAPIWIFFGRIWNYINKELLWFKYTWPLAVEVNGEYYFPSPLVEALLEWIVLFLILYYISKTKFKIYIWAIFLIWYWFFRLLVELLIRMPDSHLWYIIWPLSMWSILSIFMIIIWIIVIFIQNKLNNK